MDMMPRRGGEHMVVPGLKNKVKVTLSNILSDKPVEKNAKKNMLLLKKMVMNETLFKQKLTRFNRGIFYIFQT